MPPVHGVRTTSRSSALCCALISLVLASTAGATGTPAGTVIETQASASFDLAGIPATRTSNLTTLMVAERVDVVATLQSPQLLTSPGETGRALLFTVSNTGNGSETFSLAIDNVIAGDDFDPLAATPAIYFDTDASGDFTAADQPYTAGANDPVLGADASIDIFLVNDIPATAQDGQIGRSRLTVTSLSAPGPAGTVFAGAGDGGVDAVAGVTAGEATGQGDYLVSDIAVNLVKSQLVSDPFGGTEAVSGATISYTITVEVVGSGTASSSILSDPIPAYASFIANSMTLNGTPLTDVSDADAGEYDSSTDPTVRIRLGDLVAADGLQTFEFQVSID